MPTKYIAIGLALLLSHSAIFFAGYFKKGETEANKTTEAIVEATEKEIKVQVDLIDIGLEHADKEIEIKVVEKIIEKEVKVYVERFKDNDSCYDADGVQLINQALGYSEAIADLAPSTSFPGLSLLALLPDFWRVRLRFNF